MKCPYDALVIVSFGGPEGPDDVLPFLENVLLGKSVPKERMIEVAEHYQSFGGVSPINSQNRGLLAALSQKLRETGPDIRVYLGNRNWHPFLRDTMEQMVRDGVKKALAFVTSAYSSYSGCRQYLEDIEKATKAIGPEAPVIEKLRVFYNHPGFVKPNAESVSEALLRIPRERRQQARLVFTAHSLPLEMARACKYESQLRETCKLVGEAVGRSDWSLVYQSRSGPPFQRWLEPDVCEFLKTLREEGTTDVVVSPLGFISDHLEVLYDLDTEAATVCDEIGLNMERAATAGTHPEFVEMIRELVLERCDEGVRKRYLGKDGASHDTCPSDCCLNPPDSSVRRPER
jgi:ferrochelatase